MRILTTQDIDTAAVAARLFEQLPQKLERQTQGYTKMIKYLEHLAKGGQRRVQDDLIAANVYTTRSAAFGELKTKVSEACKCKEWAKAKEPCQAPINKHAEVCTLWNANPESLKIQNMRPYQDLLNADFGDDIDQNTKTKNLIITKKVIGDTEKMRVPWQVGKEGQFGDNIEPLDEAFVQEILTVGKQKSLSTTTKSDEELAPVITSMTETNFEDECARFKSSMQPTFITSMQKDLSAEDTCKIVNIPVTTMRVFIKALNPEFVWEVLGENFKGVILGLLEHRSGRLESRPVKKLLNLGSGKMLLTRG
jgi:hypothetical protein